MIFDWEPAARIIPPKGGESWCAFAANHIARDPTCAVLWYAAAAHAYYEEDTSIFSDEFFDLLAQRLLRVWPLHSPQVPCDFVTVNDLRAGTLLARDWPTVVVALSRACQRTIRARRNVEVYPGRHHEIRELLTDC